MKCLITGDKGYIGSNLAEFLRAHGFRVTGYDIEDGKDILDMHILEKEMKGVDFVYNCAGISGVEACGSDEAKAFEVNVRGMKNILTVAHALNVKPILFSSRAIYGNTYYGKTKVYTEHARRQAVILRLSNVFGGDGFFEKKKTVIIHFAQDDPIRVYGGQQTRDFVHISTVLKKCLEAMSLPYGIYDVCSGNETTIENLALLFGTIRNVPIQYLPPRE